MNADFLSAGMRAAVAEARKWLGATTPNPPVGAAALNERGEIIAVAAHRRAGGDHAEAALLKLCRAQNILPQVHTLCVTLEPCNHFGRTPPCSEAIIEAGIRRVAIGASDPNPHVKGGGADRLRVVGIEVIENIEADLCQCLIHAFAFHARIGRPFVTIKRAFDANGSMIPPVGQKTFTSPDSLRLAHGLRKKADAIITGSGTVLADAPLFTVRHVADFADKKRVLAILDRRGRISADYIKAATGRGFETIAYTDINSCLSDLEKRGMRDILVEAGPILSQSLLDSPHWVMKVDIYGGMPDTAKVTLNARYKIPFDSNEIDLNSLLLF